MRNCCWGWGKSDANPLGARFNPRGRPRKTNKSRARVETVVRLYASANIRAIRSTSTRIIRNAHFYCRKSCEIQRTRHAAAAAFSVYSTYRLRASITSFTRSLVLPLLHWRWHWRYRVRVYVYSTEPRWCRRKTRRAPLAVFRRVSRVYVLFT